MYWSELFFLENKISYLFAKYLHRTVVDWNVVNIHGKVFVHKCYRFLMCSTTEEFKMTIKLTFQFWKWNDLCLAIFIFKHVHCFSNWYNHLATTKNGISLLISHIDYNSNSDCCGDGKYIEPWTFWNNIYMEC